MYSGEKKDQANTERYAEVTQTCTASQIVSGDSVETFTCQSYEDVIMYTNTVGTANKDFLNWDILSTVRDQNENEVQIKSIEDILFKQVVYVNDYSLVGMYTYVAKGEYAAS